MPKKNFQKAPKPNNQPSIADIEAFEKGGAGQDHKPHTHNTTNVGTGEPVKTKRLSIDLPEKTHLRFKTICAANGLKMTREIENFIKQRCDELENRVK